jgi:hypothetical protein
MQFSKKARDLDYSTKYDVFKVVHETATALYSFFCLATIRPFPVECCAKGIAPRTCTIASWLIANTDSLRWSREDPNARACLRQVRLYIHVSSHKGIQLAVRRSRQERTGRCTYCLLKFFSLLAAIQSGTGLTSRPKISK